MIRAGVIAVLLSCAAVAGAQDRRRDRREEVDEPPPEARAQYQEGLAAMENGRWADALEAFRASYELFPATAPLYNAGVVLRSLGRLREARDVFAQLLEEFPGAPAEAREAADQMGREVAERIGEIAVIGLPPAGPDLRIRFDGDPFEDDGERPVSLEVDPGEHSLTVLAHGYEPFEWRDEIGDGEQRDVRVELDATGIPFWAWIAAGGGVALGAVIVIALLASQESDQTRLDPIPVLMDAMP